MPADFVFKLFMSLVVFNLTSSWLFGLSMLAGSSSPGYMKWEVEAQRKSIHRRIWDPLYRWQRVAPMDGELTVFMHCFYGFALVNIAASHPEDVSFSKEVLVELEQLIPIAEAATTKSPFDACGGLKPPGGIIPAGYTNLLRAGYLLLGGTSPDIVSSFHRHSQEIYDNLMSSPVPFLESYPNMIWPVDNSAALESLRLHDKLFATTYGEACVRFEKWLQDHLDPVNGMMITQVDKTGHVLDVPRGCVLSWSLAFMPGFAASLDSQQYPLFRKNWFIPVAGMYGIREWWPGQQSKSVIPSGPVIADIGAAASGLGIAATNANADREAWLGLLRGLELVSFPCINLYGEKSYCGELLLFADVMALWAKTTCVWDKADIEERLWQSQSLPQNSQPGSFLWVIAVACVTGSLVLLCLVRETIATWVVLRATPFSRWTVATRVVFATQCILALSVFLVPLFIWPYAVLGMLLLKFLERFYKEAVLFKPRETLV